MGEAKTKTDWLEAARSYARLLLLVVLPVAGATYLLFGPGALDWNGLPGGAWSWLGLFWVVILSGQVMGPAFEKIPGHGVLAAPTAQGYAWRRSIRSRLSFLVLNTILLIPVVQFWGLLTQAYGRADWGRTVVAGLLAAGFLYLLVRGCLSLFSRHTVLAVDETGVIGVGVPGKTLPWSRVERLMVSGDLEDRSVSLMTLDSRGEPGPASTVALGAAGISARRFIEVAAEMAPQVEVAWPNQRRTANFTASEV